MAGRGVLFWAVLAIASFVSANSAFGTILTAGLNDAYTGPAPIGTAPWVTIMADDQGGVGTVWLTIKCSNIQNLEFVSDVYLNLDPALNATNLDFAGLSKIGTFDSPTISKGTDAFKADGVQGYYDLRFDFSTSSGHTLNNGDSITYTVTGIPTLTQSSFAFPTLDTGLFAGAHVQGQPPNGKESSWIFSHGYTSSNATADRSNSLTAFGPAVSSEVGIGGSYTGVQSTVTGATDGNGAPMVGTIATLLAGTNSTGSDNTVSMQWRTRTKGEQSKHEVGGTSQHPPLPDQTPCLISDVLQLSGMVNTGGALGQADPYVLEMTYDPSLIVYMPGITENLLASGGWMYVAWLDPNGGGTGIPLWRNAVSGNYGGTSRGPVLGDFADLGSTGLADDLGRWGINTTDNTVWAVVDYDGQFGVVPEPATLTLITMGGLALMKRRKRTKA